jgi:hypothetical protein
MSISAEHDAPAVERLPPAVPSDPIWRFSVGEYHNMIRAGIVAEDDPVELLDGWLVPKMAKNPPHCVATDLVRQVLEQTLPKGWYVRPTVVPIVAETLTIPRSSVRYRISPPRALDKLGPRTPSTT